MNDPEQEREPDLDVLVDQVIEGMRDAGHVTVSTDPQTGEQSVTLTPAGIAHAQQIVRETGVFHPVEAVISPGAPEPASGPAYDTLLEHAIQTRTELLAASLMKASAQENERRWLAALTEYNSRHATSPMYGWS